MDAYKISEHKTSRILWRSASRSDIFTFSPYPLDGSQILTGLGSEE